MCGETPPHEGNDRVSPGRIAVVSLPTDSEPERTLPRTAKASPLRFSTIKGIFNENHSHHRKRSPMTNDIIALIANLALTFSFIVGLVFGIAQVRSARRDRKERFTLETLHRFQTREFAELMHFMATRTIPTTLKAWRRMSDRDRVTFLHFGQEMESLGILVADRLIDFDIVDKTLGSFVTTSWEKLKPVTLDIRQQLLDPFLSEYFQWLAERLTERMKEFPRKPFNELMG